MIRIRLSLLFIVNRSHLNGWLIEYIYTIQQVGREPPMTSISCACWF